MPQGQPYRISDVPADQTRGREFLNKAEAFAPGTIDQLFAAAMQLREQVSRGSRIDVSSRAQRMEDPQQDKIGLILAVRQVFGEPGAFMTKPGGEVLSRGSEQRVGSARTREIREGFRK